MEGGLAATPRDGAPAKGPPARGTQARGATSITRGMADCTEKGLMATGLKLQTFKCPHIGTDRITGPTEGIDTWGVVTAGGTPGTMEGLSPEAGVLTTTGATWGVPATGTAPCGAYPALGVTTVVGWLLEMVGVCTVEGSIPAAGGTKPGEPTEGKAEGTECTKGGWPAWGNPPDRGAPRVGSPTTWGVLPLWGGWPETGGPPTWGSPPEWGGVPA